MTKFQPELLDCIHSGNECAFHFTSTLSSSCWKKYEHNGIIVNFTIKSNILGMEKNKREESRAPTS